MIKRLSVQNFKSFENVDLELKSFNVVIGRNAAGKSNFVSLLRFLKDFTSRGLKDAVSLSGGQTYFKNIKKKGLPTSILLEFIPYFFDEEFSETNVSVQETLKLILKINGENSDTIIEHKLIETENDVVEELLDLKELDLVNILRNLMDVAKRKENIDFQATHDKLFKGLMVFGTITLLKSIALYDFDVKSCKRAISLSSPLTLEADGKNLSVVLKEILLDDQKKQKFLNILNFTLPFITDLDFEFQSLSGQILFKVKEKYNNEFFPAHLISDGTIQIILLIVALFFEKNRIVVIEEPTRELHPQLIPIIVELFKDASNLKQIIITTQNPELIKYVNLDDLIFISRTDEGYSKVERLSDKEKIKIFLENEIGLDELFIQNIFEGIN